MRILFLTHRIPYPPNKGDKIRAFHILEHLGRRHEVHLATLIDDAADLAGIPELGKRVAGTLHARIDQPGRKLFALREMLRAGSITVRHFYAPVLQQQIDALLDRLPFDAVFCSSSPMAEYVFRSRHASGQLRKAIRLMDLIDVDSFKWSQYAERSPFWSAWVYRHEARALGVYEQRIAREFDRLFVVSEQERTFFPGGPPANLQAMSNGVDLGFFAPRLPPAPPLGAHALVFTGVMDYWPNVEGVSWFVEKVFPRIQAELPDTQLFIVGTRPVPEIRKLAAVRGVTVTGFVNDVRDYIAGATLCVAPLRIARGIQNKVLEAMAMAKAVVATPQAYEGVEAAAGEDIVVAEGEAGFAEAVVALLRDPGRAARIGANARRRVEQQYTWQGNLSRLHAAGL